MSADRRPGTIHPSAGEGAAVRVRTVPRVHCGSAESFRSQLAMRASPAIVTGVVESWPAFREWSTERLRREFGDLRFRVAVHLPVDSSPYEQRAEDFIEEMTLSAALDRMASSDEATYVRRQHIDKFPGAAAAIDVLALSPDDGRPKNCFVWLGKNTLTGLHFDFTQGLLCQLLGSKTVFLAPPDAASRLDPVIGSVTKSHFLPGLPDFFRFPDARSVEFWKTDLEPGELLIIPRLWWHSVIARGLSLSVSHDFGSTVSVREMISMVGAGGVRQVVRVMVDSIRHGVLGRPYVRRLTDDPPFGKLAYDMVSSSVKSRLAR